MEHDSAEMVCDETRRESPAKHAKEREKGRSFATFGVFGGRGLGSEKLLKR